jgi:predicted negative regulator of RcsB-dependent stress response
MMNKKKISIIAAIIILAIVAYFGVTQYQSYQDEVLTENFNKNLQNASAIEANLISSTEKFNNQPSTDVDELISTINNDMTPRYAEELKILNDTHEKTKNETQKQYLSLQMKRIELQSKNLNATVTTLNAISQLYKGEKSQQDAQTSINNANKELTDSSNELNSVFTDIKTLLKQNPEFEQSIRGLHLEKSFYGENTQQAQNVTNATNTTNTTQ